MTEWGIVHDGCNTKVQPVLNWVWLSFTDDELPEGEQFLGVVVCPGTLEHIETTIAFLWKMGLNPGGQVMVIEMPAEHMPPAKYLWRLLDKAEADEAGNY